MEKLNSSLGLHVKIPAYQALKEIFEVYGFEIKKIIGGGYPPFPKRLSSLLSSLDSRHAQFITIKAQKSISRSE